MFYGNGMGFEVKLILEDYMINRQIVDEKTGIGCAMQNIHYSHDLALPAAEEQAIEIWGASHRWRPLLEAEAPTEPGGETSGTGGI